MVDTTRRPFSSTPPASAAWWFNFALRTEAPILFLDTTGFSRVVVQFRPLGTENTVLFDVQRFSLLASVPKNTGIRRFVG